MAFKEIVDKFSNLPICEERQRTDDYIELVIFTEQMKQWEKLLADILGPALKGPSEKPSSLVIFLARRYGGVRPHQVLYKGEFGQETVVALLWPWRDMVHTTLKLGRFKTKELVQESKWKSLLGGIWRKRQ